MRQPTHVPVFFLPPSMAAESLSLACARESNQREHTLTAAVAGEAGDCASPFRRFADGTSVCRQRTHAHPARAPAGFFLHGLAATERDPEAKSGAEKSRAEQSGAERSRAEQSRA